MHADDDVVTGKITEDEGKKRVLGKHGGDHKSREFTENNQHCECCKVEYGTKKHIELRLEKERPDLYAQVKSNKISHHAAAIQAANERVLLLWRKATTASKGRPENSDRVTIKSRRGNHKDYLLDRLYQEHKETANQEKTRPHSSYRLTSLVGI